MPKTSTERSVERRERLRKQGYKELRNLWVKPKHEAMVRAYAKKLDKRGK